MYKKLYKETRYALTAYHKILLIMRITTVILIASLMQVSASTLAQKIRLSKTNAPLMQVLKDIKLQTGYNYVITEDLLKHSKPVTVNLKEAQLNDALDKVFAGQSLAYKIENRTIMIKRNSASHSFMNNLKEALNIDITVKGVVTDDTGLPLPAASIKIGNKMIKSDSEGKFSVSAEAGTMITVSFVGYQSFSFNVSEGMDFQNIILKEAAGQLGEVVVNTGYQTISKERATGAFSVVTARDFKNNLSTNIMSRLEGKVAGLVQYKGAVAIRGISTVYGNMQPLYVIDGIPYEGNIEVLNPNEVESLTVLKDATAASIYGARAANGVIVITTKSGHSGKTRVSYNGSVSFQPAPNLDYLKLMNTGELIDLKRNLFNDYHPAYSALNKRASIDEITQLFYDRELGTLTEDQLQQKLGVYSNFNSKEQIKDELLRPALTQQQNISLSGGTDKHTYLASMNYLGSDPYNKAQNSKRYGFNVKNQIKFFDWMTADLGIVGSFTEAKGNNGINGMSLLTSNPSFRM